MNRRDLLVGLLAGSFAGTVGLASVMSVERVKFKPWKDARDDSRRRQLDKLVAEYNEAFNGATELGDQVIYSRANWDEIREAFTRIIAFVS